MLCLPVNFIVLREQAEEVNKSSNEWINEWMIEGKKYFKQNTVLREGGWRNRRIGISFTIALSLTGGRNLSLSKLGFMTWWDYISLHQHQPGASFAFIRHGTPREYFPWKWNVALPPSLPLIVRKTTTYQLHSTHIECHMSVHPGTCLVIWNPREFNFPSFPVPLAVQSEIIPVKFAVLRIHLQSLSSEEPLINHEAVLNPRILNLLLLLLQQLSREFWRICCCCYCYYCVGWKVYPFTMKSNFSLAPFTFKLLLFY